MNVDTTSHTDDSLVLSYLSLRKAVGTIGMLLPFVMVFGKMILESPGILSSISSYYYSDMGNVFIGSLCAIGVFLWSYNGYGRTDAIAGNIAGTAAIGVGIFPTAPDTVATATQTIIGNVHLISASIFFLTLAFFSLALFRKTNPAIAMTSMKLVRNTIYTACGIVILLCIALIVITKFLPSDSPILALSPTFWLESIAIISFGISWFVKGEAILKDN